MDILHLRPTKSGKINGVQNRSENPGIPQDQFPKQNLQPPPKRKPSPLHWAGPASPSLGDSGPSRSAPPNPGSSSSPHKVSTFHQVPYRLSGPIPLSFQWPILFTKREVTKILGGFIHYLQIRICQHFHLTHLFIDCYSHKSYFDSAI